MSPYSEWREFLSNAFHKVFLRIKSNKQTCKIFYYLLVFWCCAISFSRTKYTVRSLHIRFSFRGYLSFDFAILKRKTRAQASSSTFANYVGHRWTWHYQLYTPDRKKLALIYESLEKKSNKKQQRNENQWREKRRRNSILKQTRTIRSVLSTATQLISLIYWIFTNETLFCMRWRWKFHNFLIRAGAFGKFFSLSRSFTPCRLVAWWLLRH